MKGEIIDVMDIDIGWPLEKIHESLPGFTA